VSVNQNKPETSNKPGYKKTKLGWIPEEWVFTELQDIVEPKRKISYGIVQTGKPIENGVKCVRVVDIKSGSINPEELITTSEKISNSYKKTILREGDLIIALRGKIGELAIVSKDLAGANLTRGVALIAPREGHSPKYLYYAIGSSYSVNHFNRSLNGSALKEISIGTLRKHPVALPPLPEQKKIAQILSTWDKTIAKLEALIAEKEQLKKGLMQQLLTGKKRFPGFMEEWKEAKLGEVAEIVGGGTPDTTDSKYWNGEIQWFTPTEIKSKYIYKSQRTLSRDGLKNSSAKLLPKDTILFTSRATIGDVGIATEECATNQGFQSLLPGDFDVNFMFYLLNQINHEFVRRSSGSTFLEISKKEIQKVKIKIPNNKEQIRIGGTISKLDEEISILRTQSSVLVKEKKGLMQKLLTGEVRVKIDSE
jgi:type I restriction enzyme S subunit